MADTPAIFVRDEDDWQHLLRVLDSEIAATVREAQRLLASVHAKPTSDPWESLPRALSSADLAHLLRVGRTTVHDALRRGDLPPPTLRLGAQGRRLWARGTIRSWLDQADAPAQVGGNLVVTLDEAAEVLGLGRSTVYELHRTGRLRAVRVGRLLRFPAAAVEALRLELERPGTVDPGNRQRHADPVIRRSGAGAGPWRRRRTPRHNPEPRHRPPAS
jgi:excisionase family DNA binding protein